MALHNEGALAQLVERLNGIEEVSGSNPLCSTPSCGIRHRNRHEHPRRRVRDSEIQWLLPLPGERVLLKPLVSKTLKFLHSLSFLNHAVTPEMDEMIVLAK